MSRTHWMIVLAATLVAGQFAWADDGFKPIFNGENLEGWVGDQRFWSVEDGHIVARTTTDNPAQQNTFLIWDQGEVDDFELRFRYRIDSDYANSGVQIRSQRMENYAVRGYQPDIATTDWITGIFYEERGRGVIARRGQEVVINADGSKQTSRFAQENELGQYINADDWNEYHVIARGNRIITKINGQKMHEVVDNAPEARDRGIIAFQLHSGRPMTIRFADVQLKRLALADDRKKVVFVAGVRSHGYGNHEHRAGSMLLAEHLEAHVPGIVTAVYTEGYPNDPTAFDNADAVVVYSNGAGQHPLLPHLAAFDKVMDRGVGFVALHFAVEVPKGDPGEYFLKWMGGYFETHWSVNPFWDIEGSTIAEDHPITRGMEPYEINDEWYYHMRFQDDGVTPILTALPPAESLSRPDGPHSGNPHVRRAVADGRPQHVAWAYERDNGGRGFGFTGGHYHWNWAHPMQRRLALNAIVWAARADVPQGGVPVPALTMEQLKANQDYDQPPNFNLNHWQTLLDRWNEQYGPDN